MSNDANENTDPAANDNLKDLREAADRGKKVPGLERELAFVKAGIDTDSKLGKMFLATYDGDLTKEAITAEATEIGLVKPAAAPPAGTDPLVEQQQREQQRIRDNLSQGAPSGDEPPPTPDPYDKALGEFHAAMANGTARDSAGLGAIDTILEAAGQGDKRVLHR